MVSYQQAAGVVYGIRKVLSHWLSCPETCPVAYEYAHNNLWRASRKMPGCFVYNLNQMTCQYLEVEDHEVNLLFV